jgi:hypothetical protein
MEQFPGINIEFLKLMAKRWVKKYHDRGVSFNRILLYSYVFEYDSVLANAANTVGYIIPIKYAVVFEILNYKHKYQLLSSDTPEIIEQKLLESEDDPYNNFIMDTMFYGNTGESQVELFYSDFSGVYLNGAPEDIYKEW